MMAGLSRRLSQVTVHAVFRDVEPPADWNHFANGGCPFQHRAPRGAPEQFARLLGPERLRLLDGEFVKCLILGQRRHTRLGSKLRRAAGTHGFRRGRIRCSGRDRSWGGERPTQCVAPAAFAQVLSAGASADGRRGRRDSRLIVPEQSGVETPDAAHPGRRHVQAELRERQRHIRARPAQDTEHARPPPPTRRRSDAPRTRKTGG